jgi:hypothetical protein
MPRRKIARGTRAPVKLTAKQWKFCEGVLVGLSLSDAYRAAYDAQNMSAPAIHCEASRLRNDPRVALWLDAVQSEHVGDTLADHLKELNRLKAIAIRTGNVGAAVLAEQLRGKARGHYVEQYADVSYDPIATLNELAQHDPELARQLADAHGITWEGDKAKPGTIN